MGRLNKMQTYLRLFLLISIAFLMLAISFTAAVSTHFSNYAYTEIERYSGDRLQQTLDNTEFIFQKLKSYGLHMYDDPDLKNWMLSPHEQGIIQTAASNTLSRFITYEPFISSVSMFNFVTERVFDSREGLLQTADYGDKALLRLVQNSPAGYLEFFSHEVNGASYLALRLPTNTMAVSSGHMVMLLNASMLKNYLLQSNREAGVQVVILDEGGRSVLGDIDASLSRELAGGEALCAEPFRFNQGGDSWIVNCAKLPSQNWLVYYLTRMDGWERQVLTFQYFVIAGVLILTLVLLSFLFWNLRKHVRPFSQIAAELRSKLKGRSSALDEKGKEWAIIEQGIELLVSHMDDISDSMRSHQVLIKEELLRQWILSGKLTSDIRRYLEKESRLMEQQALYLAVLRIEDYKAFTDAYSFSSRRLLKFAMGNIAEEVSRHCGLATESVDMGGDHIVLLLGTAAEETSLPCQTLEKVLEQIQRFLHIPAVAAVSDARSGEDDIRFAYEHIVELTMLKFVSGEQKVYLEEDYELYVRVIEPLSVDAEVEQLVQAVRAGQTEQAEKLLDRIVHDMQSLPYQECRFQLIIILYAITRSFNQIMERAQAQSISSLLDQFNTLQDVRDWLAGELRRINEPRASGDESADRKLEIAGEVEEYIRGHIHDPMLNAEQIAAHIALSVRWIRQIFKDVRGMTVSDYILSLRIDNVKRLLTASALTVTEIAEHSGFLTKSHFFAAFKKSTGLTPNEYRQIHRAASCNDQM